MMSLDPLWLGLLVFWIALFILWIWRFLKFESLIRDFRAVLNSLGMLLTQFQNIIKSGSETIEKMQNFHKVVQNQKKIAEMLTCLYHDGAAIHPKLLEEVESIYKE